MADTRIGLDAREQEGGHKFVVGGGGASAETMINGTCRGCGQSRVRSANMQALSLGVFITSRRARWAEGAFGPRLAGWV